MRLRRSHCGTATAAVIEVCCQTLPHLRRESLRQRRSSSSRSAGALTDYSIATPVSGIQAFTYRLPSRRSWHESCCEHRHVEGNVRRVTRLSMANPQHCARCSMRWVSAILTNGPGGTPSSACGESYAATRARSASEDLTADEERLHHLREDVITLSSASSQGTSTSGAATAFSASGAPLPQAVGDAVVSASKATVDRSEADGAHAEAEWEEPTLKDLDRSIPQVDCEFIANLIRSRNLRREDFFRKKEAVKQRVERLMKTATRSVEEAVRLPLVGGLGLGWFRRQKGSDESGDEESGLVATSAEAPVVVSRTVLEQLNDEEKDQLYATRPEYDDGFVLLDCRTVNEVTSWGIIEGAKVLPAHELFEAFHATPEEFLQDYGFAKPRPDDIVICYCQYGPRSLMAAQILSWMGYLKVMHFRDGYYEWGKQYNLLLRRWMEHDKESGNELRRLATFRAGLELQREIAPEFNALPMQEAQQYIKDTTRSPGSLLVGENLRVEAYKMVAKLTEGLAPTALPGVSDDRDGFTLSGSSVGERSAESNSARARRLGEQQLTRFLEEATGLDAKKELSRPTTAINLGEAQATVLDSLAYGYELGVSPDTKTSPKVQPPRRK